jgi:hypothetical protein
MTLETAAHVGPDGRLELNLPSQFANSDVILTIRPANGAPIQRIADIQDPEERQRQWKAFVEKTAGSIDDPTFERPDQGWYEERETL